MYDEWIDRLIYGSINRSIHGWMIHATKEEKPSGNERECIHIYGYRASLRAASCKFSVSTSAGFIITNRTTLPRMNKESTVASCGNRSLSKTWTFSSLMLSHWSTECRMPFTAKSFFSSTVTSLPTSVLKKL